MAVVLSDTALMAQIKAAGFTGQDAVIAFAVARAESGGNSAIVSKPNNNGSVDRGLFQINSKAWPQFNAWNDPGQNAAFAHDVVLKQQGWTAWSAFNNKSYLKYITNAVKAYGMPAGNSVTGNVNPGTSPAVVSGGLSNRFAGILNKELWIRIGMGAVGIAAIAVGITLVNFKDISSVVKDVAT